MQLKKFRHFITIRCMRPAVKGTKKLLPNLPKSQRGALTCSSTNVSAVIFVLISFVSTGRCQVLPNARGFSGLIGPLLEMSNFILCLCLSGTMANIIFAEQENAHLHPPTLKMRQRLQSAPGMEMCMFSKVSCVVICINFMHPLSPTSLHQRNFWNLQWLPKALTLLCHPVERLLVLSTK